MTPKNEHRRLCSTKASRAKLVAEIQSLATECGATAVVRENTREENSRGRDIGVVLGIGEWRCMMHFDGDSHVDAFLGHWYSDNLESKATLPKNFGLTIRGSENEYHHRKATTCTDTFDEFKASLRAGFSALRGSDASS